MLAWSWSGEGPLLGHRLLLVSSQNRRWLGITLGPLIRGYFHSWGFPHDLSISSKLHQQISSCLGLGFQHMNLRRLGSFKDFPGGSEDKQSTCNAGEIRDKVSILESRRSSGGGHGHPLQYCCLENPMDRGGWLTTVHGVTKSWTRLRKLCRHTYAHSTEHFCGLGLVE